MEGKNQRMVRTGSMAILVVHRHKENKIELGYIWDDEVTEFPDGLAGG